MLHLFCRWIESDNYFLRLCWPYCHINLYFNDVFICQSNQYCMYFDDVFRCRYDLFCLRWWCGPLLSKWLAYHLLWGFVSLSEGSIFQVLEWCVPSLLWSVYYTFRLCVPLSECIYSHFSISLDAVFRTQELLVSHLLWWFVPLSELSVFQVFWYVFYCQDNQFSILFNDVLSFLNS